MILHENRLETCMGRGRKIPPRPSGDFSRVPSAGRGQRVPLTTMRMPGTPHAAERYNEMCAFLKGGSIGSDIAHVLIITSKYNMHVTTTSPGDQRVPACEISSLNSQYSLSYT